MVSERDELEEVFRLMLRVQTIGIVSGCLCGAALLASDMLGIDYKNPMCLSPIYAEKSRSFATQLLFFSLIFLAAFVFCIRLSELFEITPNIIVGISITSFAAFLLLPLHTCIHESIDFLVSTGIRVFFPSSDVSFTEVLVADAFTSLTRTFSDAGLALIMMISSFAHVFPSLTRTQRLFITVILSCLPSVLRARQCAILYTAEMDGQKRFMHAMNMGKYISAIFPVVLGAIHVLEFPVFDNWPVGFAAISAAIFSTIYCLIWDVRMDWGLGDIFSKYASGKKHENFRRVYKYGSIAPYYIAVVLDVFLRCTWVLSYIDICSLNFSFIQSFGCTVAKKGTFLLFDLTLVLEILEVIRRSMWMILRLEWEFSHRYIAQVEKE